MNRDDKEIDWGEEFAVAVGAVGKSVLKLLGWIFNILMTLFLIGVITGTIVGGAFLLYVNRYLDTGIENFSVMVADQNMTTHVSYLDEKGNITELTAERLNAEENRVWVKYADMGQYMTKAIIAIEDKRFETHKGVDWISVMGIPFKMLTGDGTMRGGSTITMQLIKNVTGDDEVSIQRKAAEIIKALNLEKKYDKTEILEMYLNEIYLSEGCYGVGAAAYTYFSKEVKDLTLIEAAAIAGITQNPYQYDPILYPENNAKRRNVVLKYMYDQEKITKEEFDSAYGKELVLHVPADEDTGSRIVHSWYTDAAQQEAIKLLRDAYGYSASFAEKVLLTGGYNIVTAMDPRIQKIVEDFYENDANWEQHDASPIQPQSSCVIVNPENGNVVALVGSRGKKTINLGLNYATQTKRPPGSSLKPVSVYGPALEYGYITYGTVFDDAPINFGNETFDKNGNKVYANKHGYPKNSPDRYRGLTTINEGIRVSINTISWHTLEKLGFEKSYEFLTQKVGISSLIYSQTTTGGYTLTDLAFAPLALGQLTYGVTVKELTAAYQIFPTGGIYNEERIVLQILDADGNVVVDNPKKSTIVMSAENASIMTKMLQSVVSSGTANAIKLKNNVDCAGKTGTTEDDHDRWFVGFTPYYVCGIWMGYSMPRSLTKFSSGSPMPVVAWDKIMTQVLADKVVDAAGGGTELKKFELAAGVTTCEYCKDSGKLATEACKKDPRSGSRIETGFFVKGTEPTEYCDVHVLVNYDKKTKSIATQWCPEENIEQIGLLNVSRVLPFNIQIQDACYTMQYLPIDYSFEGLTDLMPYYQNLLPKGFFTGHYDVVTKNGGECFNRICSVHHAPAQNPSGDEP